MAGRFLGAIFGLVFAGVGITIIVSLWFGEMGEHAPLIFKMVGSLISTAFIAMGGTIAFAALFGKGMPGAEQTIEHVRQMQASQQTPTRPATSAGPGNYVCPHCGGKLTRADVSPMGDVKCAFCGAWFNVHGRS